MSATLSVPQRELLRVLCNELWPPADVTARVIGSGKGAFVMDVASAGDTQHREDGFAIEVPLRGTSQDPLHRLRVMYILARAIAYVNEAYS